MTAKEVQIINELTDAVEEAANGLLAISKLCQATIDKVKDRVGNAKKLTI